MGKNTFTTEELRRLRDFYEASEEYGLDWPLAVLAFPAQTEGEKNWKIRMLAGIRVVEAMISRSTPIRDLMEFEAESAQNERKH